MTVEGVRRRARMPRVHLTLVGLALFALGFTLTVYSLSSTDGIDTSGGFFGSASGSSGAEGEDSGLLIWVGLAVGMSGIVIATVGPAVAAYGRTEKSD